MREVRLLLGASVATLLALVWDNLTQRQLSADLAARLRESQSELLKYSSLVPRADNPAWQELMHAERLRRDEWEGSEAFRDDLFAPEGRFPHGHNLSSWAAHLRATTPSAFEETDDADTTPGWCSGDPDLSGIVMSESELHTESGKLSAETRRRAHRALTECGYVYLDNFFSSEAVTRLREAYVALRDSDEGEQMKYPCQGTGRIEHMLPFRHPFNDSTIYADPRLLTLLTDFLQEQFKLELMTVINSPPGSLHQRWHQGWRYLFHPEERLPPYAVVVALPLGDVYPAMGPTEMCPGKKRRFYHGWRCEEHSIRVASTSGTLAIFDYKTLHRGPGNLAEEDRPMLSLVFSKMFFLNTEVRRTNTSPLSLDPRVETHPSLMCSLGAQAVVNRGISLAQTLHQRRYWEQFAWHPSSRDEQWTV